MQNEWDERYRTKDTPWDSGVVSGELVRVMDALGLSSGRALDVGCGTGADSVWLARRGFDVTGIDFVERAIEQARERASREGVSCRFQVADVLNDSELSSHSWMAVFDFIFDGGCFHVVRQEDEAAAVANLRRWVKSDGHVLVLTGNADEQAEKGPPRLSEAEIRAAFEPVFEIVHLRAFRFETGPQLDYDPLGWSVLMRPKLS